MLIAIIAYMVLQLGVGIWASRRIHSEKDYIIAGQSLGLTLTTFSLFATWFGAETVMGSSAAIAEQGLAGSRADPFGYTFALLLMAVLIAYRMRHLGLVTMGDFFRKKYSRSTEVLAATIMMSTATIWSAAQLLAFGTIIGTVAGIDKETALITATLLVMVYTSLGGMLGDVVTDFIQGSILIIGLVILLVFVFQKAGGVGAGLAMIEPSQLSFAASDETFLQRLNIWMIPILGSLVSQEATSRVLASRTPEIARKASFMASGIYFTIGCIPMIAALIGTHYVSGLEERDQFILALAQQMLPAWLYVVLVGALVSAILSTVDSTFLSVGSLFSHNILTPMLPNISEKKKVLLTRASVIGAGVIAYIMATKGENIYSLLMTESSFGTAGLLVVVLAGLLFKSHNSMAASVTLAVGIISTFTWEKLGFSAPFLMSITVCIVTFVLVSVVKKKVMIQPT